ncbi:MAG: AzlD domain-containing protein, partial [Deferribacterales bacterium]|nr:AzlD domain-containing protein [Deferribacterales bacterium]
VSFENYKIYASIVALLIALKFKNAIITILSGLIVVWTLTYFL